MWAEEWPELDRGGNMEKVYLWGLPDHWTGHQDPLFQQDYSSPAEWLPSRSGPTPIFSADDRDIEAGKTQTNPLLLVCRALYSQSLGTQGTV